AAGAVAYATDEANQFGFEDDERGVINHVHIEYPYGSYDSDSPTSVQRYGRRTRADSWLVENDDVADVILNSRSFATMQARPMFTTVELAGFWPEVPKLDVTHPIEIVHSTAAGRAILTAEARVRSISETIRPVPEVFAWEATIISDVEQYATELSLLPVEDLAVEELEDQFVEFSWSNPDGQPVEPTETWVRMR